MEISIAGNYNAVNRALATHNQDDRDPEIRKTSDAARANELLTREAQTRALPPATAPEKTTDEGNTVPQRRTETGRRVNITV